MIVLDEEIVRLPHILRKPKSKGAPANAVEQTGSDPGIIVHALTPFLALAREFTVVPVWREVLADLTTPVAAFLRIVGDEPGFLLESPPEFGLDGIRIGNPPRHVVFGRAAR